MNIEEKLSKLNEIKQQSLTAIHGKGVELSETAPFEDYPEAIESIEQGLILTRPLKAGVYSFDEALIGLWDGKEYFRRVFQVTTPNTSGDVSVLNVPNNLDVLAIYGTVIYNNRQPFSINTVNGEFFPDWSIQTWYKRGEIMMNVGTSLRNKTAYVVLEYTK